MPVSPRRLLLLLGQPRPVAAKSSSSKGRPEMSSSSSFSSSLPPSSECRIRQPDESDAEEEARQLGAGITWRIEQAAAAPGECQDSSD